MPHDDGGQIQCLCVFVMEEAGLRAQSRTLCDNEKAGWLVYYMNKKHCLPFKRMLYPVNSTHPVFLALGKMWIGEKRSANYVITCKAMSAIVDTVPNADLCFLRVVPKFYTKLLRSSLQILKCWLQEAEKEFINTEI